MFRRRHCAAVDVAAWERTPKSGAPGASLACVHPRATLRHPPRRYPLTPGLSRHVAVSRWPYVAPQPAVAAGTERLPVAAE